MDVRHPFSQVVATTLMAVMLVNPTLVRATELALDAAAGGNVSLGQAANGVPLVNINTPSASGLSHNQFTDYNVGQQGLILNNSAEALTPTKLGGYIVGNPNLQGGSARLILNEVTGGNTSRLAGYTEVAGQAAHVVVANPHGITCDGCGFINTPRATLTTGTPLVDQGTLTGYEVTQGRIAVEGDGLNASNVGQFELITRAAEINAQIHAQQLTVVTGQNDVDAQTLAVTAKASDGSAKPSLAIDSSALGGMYAGAIRLVGTEAGVGVRLDGDLVASAGDIQIDANGQLTLARSATASDLTIKAHDVSFNGDTYAKGSGQINADHLRNDGVIQVQGDLSTQAARLTNSGDLSVGGNAHLQVDRLENHGQLIAQGSLSAESKQLQNGGTLGAAEGVRIDSRQIVNDGGLLFSGADMSLRSNEVVNRQADILSLGRLDIAQDDEGGRTAALENISGTIESAGDMTLLVDDLLNRKERFFAVQERVSGNITLTGTDNCKGDHCEASYQLQERYEPRVAEDSPASMLIAGKNFAFSGDRFENRLGTVSAAGSINVDAHSFLNMGAGGGQERRASYYIYDSNDNAYWAFINNLARYNLLNDPDSPSYAPQTLSFEAIAMGWQTGGGWVNTSGHALVNAVVQAGGSVDINASQTLENSVIHPNGSGSAHITLQLPADLAQRLVDPLALSGFSLPAGAGLFRLTTDPGHRYLIESNPLFASLAGFLSSDYMLGLLGYTEESTLRRLGDGLYEQRLIREAIIARTGKRFLVDALATDEAQFRYLMDNGIASKESLNLSVGISLTPEQVAALTHDIVWMEAREVAGEKVLIPVLYLAQTSGRLAPNGALIQGGDLKLISGNSLHNSGVLRAPVIDMQAMNMANRGLAQADDRLSLLAMGDIRNSQGGILAGHSVEVISLSGDVINERSVTTNNGQNGGHSWRDDVVDSAARIEAVADLVLQAGRDLNNSGGVIQSAANAQLLAGRDLLISAATEVDSTQTQLKKTNASSQTITQHGSEVKIGGNLIAEAGRDITVLTSKVAVGRDLTMSAAGDIAILSAANESHSFAQSQKMMISNDQVRQQFSVIQVGQDVDIEAGQDLILLASQIKAGNDLALSARQDVQVLSAQDESAAYYYKKSRDVLGRTKTEQRESYDSLNIASVIEAGNDLTINTSKGAEGGLSINGGRDVTVIGSQLKAGNDLLVGATGNVAILSGLDEHGSFNKKTKSGFSNLLLGSMDGATISLGSSKSSVSQLKTSTTQVASQLGAGSDVVIAAGNDIRLRASAAVASGDVELRAGLLNDAGDINLVAASDEAYSLAEQYKKKVGLSVSGGILSIAAAKTAGNEMRSSSSVASQVRAEGDATLLAARDINVIGSSVSAGRNLLLGSGRDVNVAAAHNQQDSRDWQRVRRTGIGLESDRNGVTVFAGNDVQIEKGLNARQTASASVLEAGNDLNVSAGRDTNVSGSDVFAGRDINVLAERDINLDAATELNLQQRQETHQRNGLTVNVSHNFGNTLDALKGIGQGENLVSQVSGVLKAADAVTQFFSGPTTAIHLGATQQQNTTVDGFSGSRPTSFSAGRDVNLKAGSDFNVKGGQIQAERDVAMSARDISLDIAREQKSSSTTQVISQSGINGGSTFNSARAGIGGSHGVHAEAGVKGSALATQIHAGRDMYLEASRDLALIGTQAAAGRDISLLAGNDIDIRAAQNDSTHEMRRKSGGGELGLALGGQDFISIYASVDIGKGHLDRDEARQQDAYLYAGQQLSFDSGRDTSIVGARLEGQDVIGRVGRDLLVSSAADTGQVSGKELDASLTVSVGIYGSVSVSGSLGLGKTNGSMHWVDNQTAIVARDRLDIYSGNHTQLDGAVLASDNGNLKLDTGTLGFRDIAGYDREHAWYINAGGTYSWAGDSATSGQPVGGNAAAASAVVDPSQQNKDGSNSWNLSGYDYRKEREQILRATVGEGAIVVRSDVGSERDSVAGLNRDLGKSYEITKDKDARTDFYVSQSSVDAVSDPMTTFDQWKQGAKNYGRNSAIAFLNLGVLKEGASSAAEHSKLVAALAWVPALLVDAIDAMGTPTLGFFPGVANHGGVITQLPVLVTGDLMPWRVTGKFKTDAEGTLVLEDGKPVLDLETVQVELLDGFNEKEDAVFTNGIMNSMSEALANGLMQTGSSNGEVSFVLAYNPTHGLAGDLMESSFDKAFKGAILSGTARNLNELYRQAIEAKVQVLHLSGHSQGGLLTWVAMKGLSFYNAGNPTEALHTVQLSGAPVDAMQFHRDAENAGFERGQSVFQVNRPDETVFFGLLPKTDAVSDLPILLGGNAQYSSDPVARTFGALFSLSSLFGADSPHSNYGCVTCEISGLSGVDTQIRNIVIRPTLIDGEGNLRRLE